MSRFSSSKFKTARERAGQSQEQVAVAIGRSWRSVYGYERGFNAPPLLILGRIADTLGVEIADLLEPVEPAA